MKNVTKMLLMLLVFFQQHAYCSKGTCSDTPVNGKLRKWRAILQLGYWTGYRTTGAVTYLTTSLNPPGNVKPYDGNYMAVYNAAYGYPVMRPDWEERFVKQQQRMASYHWILPCFTMWQYSPRLGKRVWSLDAVTWKPLPGAILRYDGTYGWKFTASTASGTGLRPMSM